MKKFGTPIGAAPGRGEREGRVRRGRRAVRARSRGVAPPRTSPGPFELSRSHSEVVVEVESSAVPTSGRASASIMQALP